jgi:ribosomal protein S18 acetylase RimI-like enzyme
VLKRLFLDVVETNTPAIALYARKGFVPTGEAGTLPPPRDHIREIQLVMML